MKFLILWIVFLTFLWGTDATLEVSKGVESLPKLAIEDSTPIPDELSKKMFQVLKADMEVTTLFDVDQSYGVSAYDSSSAAINHLKFQYLLKYRLSQFSDGVHADVKLIQNGSELFTKSYVLKQADMAVFLAHSIAYDINVKMGGAPMDWIKRKVLLVRFTAPRRSDIVATDYTLAYQKVVLSGGLYGFVKWANQQQTDFYYTSLSDFRPTIYKVNLATGQKSKIISSDGMAVCSDVSHDGQKLLMTLAPNGQPDIFLYDTLTQGKTRLTDYSGIDVSGQFFGNDSIAFVSNRMGYPNIFTKKMNSSAVMPLVYSGKNNSSLSSYKNLLVYKARESGGTFGGNSFNLHLVSLNSNAVKRITAGGINDFPRFSGDGEAIMFIKQDNGKSSVGVFRLAVNKSFIFPLKMGRIESIDW